MQYFVVLQDKVKNQILTLPEVWMFYLMLYRFVLWIITWVKKISSLEDYLLFSLKSF